MSDLIAEALKSATDTRACLVGRGVVTRTGEMFTQLFPGRRAVIIADGNHWRVAGEQVVDSLTAAGVEQIEPFLYPATPTLYAGYDHVDELREFLRPLTDVTPVCVSSGSLNDLVKRACSELDRTYMCVGTAASMDGYIAFGSSITKDGFKQQMTCPAPLGMVADVDIMAGAPQRLTATGFGDLIEKIPAGADWIIADALGIETLDQEMFDLVQNSMPAALADPQGCKDGDPDALKGLVDGLMISGLAIQGYKNSRPGSGGGHHFSHIWEMEGYGLDWEPPLSHGFKVGLGTVACAALYDEVLAADLPALIDVEAAVAAWPTWEGIEAKVAATLPENLVEKSLARVKLKYVGPEVIRERLETLVANWPQIRERIAAQHIPAPELQAKLDTIGAVTHPAQIGMDLERMHATYDKARWIRERYVLTDILTEAGVFDELVDKLFAPGGYWAERPVPPAMPNGE